MGAVTVGGRFFTVDDVEKLLYHWASVRNLPSDIIASGHVRSPTLEIEGLMPSDIVFGCYSAARQILQTVPADYDTVYVYAKNLSQIEQRFKFEKGRINLIVLAADNQLTHYGQYTTLAQTFVDLWNLGDWQAKDFSRAIKEKIDGLLS